MLHSLADRLLAARARRQMGPKRGLLLVSSGGIGDSILFSLMVERFMALIDDDEPVTLVVRNESLNVGFLFPERVNLIGVDYRRFIRRAGYKLETCKQIRALNARIAVSTDHLRLPTVDDVVIMASGADEKFALTPRTWPKHDAALARHRDWYTDWVTPAPEMAHRLIRWCELIDGLTGTNQVPPKVTFTGDRLPDAARGEKPRIVLHPFSAIAEREAAPEVFQAVAEAYRDSHEIVLSAGPGDLERAPRHRPLAEMDGVTADTASFRDKAALVRGADLVVSVDTSVMHLAVGAGAKTVCLASAAHIVDSVPYDSRITPANVRFEVPDIDCAGCLGACIHPLESGRYKCLGQITPARTLAACRKMLAGGPGGV